jgi:hypothetical protein
MMYHLRTILIVVLIGFIVFAAHNNLNANDWTEVSTSISVKHEQNFHYTGCSTFNSLSTTELWREIQGPVMLNSTFLPDDNNHTNNETVREQFTKWTKHLMEFHTPERLRNALANRPSSSSVRRILSIISDYPRTKIPLKILVTGGSVTHGGHCIENPVGWDNGESPVGGNKDCAWPNRLERHLRQLFFNDHTVPGVIVDSMASGGVSIDIATMVLEYQLVSMDLLTPDIMLFAHSPNDANLLDPDELFYKHLNNAVKVARGLRACDDDLPLVGLIVDNVGMENISKSMETTARYNAIASWYGLLMINHSNVVRHTLLRRYDKGRTDPLLGNKFNVHGGIGFHISIAWTVLFSFITLMMEACQDGGEDEQASLITSERWESEAKLTSLQDVPWGMSPSKQIGGLYRTSDPLSVNQEWLNNLKAKEQHCESRTDSDNSQPMCTYAWFVNKLTGIMNSEHVNQALAGVITSSNGWRALGNFWSKPQLAYIASAKNAEFSLEIPVTAPTATFTIFSMESYGPKFVGTNLRIDVKVESNNTVTTYNVSGYHEMKTSVIVPHKFQLPGTVNEGETIYFSAILTSGTHFQISGMVFCRN